VAVKAPLEFCSFFTPQERILQMQPLTMELIERMDREPRIEKFLCHTRAQTMGHEDNILKICELAQALGVTQVEVSSYVWLQCYIRELIETYSELPDVAVVAQQFGISLDKFQDYIAGREVALCEALSFNGPQLLLTEESEAAAEEERIEAQVRGMTVYEWREYLADLQQDADLQN